MPIISFSNLIINTKTLECKTFCYYNLKEKVDNYSLPNDNEIQNTFTPNGDGKNDTWNITALEAFPTHEIKVVNRNGQTVFNNKGSYLPWDGKFNQKDAPVGSYYYTIYLNDDFKTLSGWVFVIR